MSDWSQRGSRLEIVGGNNYHSYVSLNAAGDIIAVGDKTTSEAANGATVYQWSGSAWVQMGSPLGVLSSVYEGTSFSLSGTGTRIVVGYESSAGSGGYRSGAVEVYDWNSSTSTWEQVGTSIYGLASQNRLGNHVHISKDGNTIVMVGGWFGTASFNEAWVYYYDGADWVKRGASIIRENYVDGDIGIFEACKLSNDGTVLLLGDYRDDAGTGNKNQGMMRIFNWDGSAWVQRGVDIRPPTGGHSTGYYGWAGSIDMSDDGSKVAWSSSYDKQAIMYSWDGSTWNIVGSPIPDPSPTPIFYRQFGRGVAMNGDGTYLAVSANHTALPDNSLTGVGALLVYKYSNGAWTQQGSTMYGNENNHIFASNTAMNEDGSVVTGNGGMYGALVFRLPLTFVPANLSATDGIVVSDTKVDFNTVAGFFGSVGPDGTPTEKQSFFKNSLKTLLTDKAGDITGKSVNLSKDVITAAGYDLSVFSDADISEIVVKNNDSSITTNFESADTIVERQPPGKLTYTILPVGVTKKFKDANNHIVNIRRTSETEYRSSLQLTDGSTETDITNNISNSVPYNKNGLIVIVGSSISGSSYPRIDMVLTALESSLTLTKAAELQDVSYSLLSDADITLNTDISATDIRNVFFYKADDPITADASFVYYFVDKSSFANVEDTLNPFHGIVTRSYFGNNTNDHVGKDFIRYLAQGLFGTYLGADLFTNEDALVSDISGKCHTVANTIIAKIDDVDITSSNLTFTDASLNNYKYLKDLNANTNLCREVVNQLITLAPERFVDISQNYAYNSTPGYYQAPFLSGDKIQYKLTVTPATNQYQLTNLQSALSPRSYTIILRIT